MQNLTYRFLEFLIAIEVMTSQFSTVVFFPVNHNCSRQIVKKAGLSPFCEKIGILPSFLKVLRIFLSNGWLQNGTSYTHTMLIFKIRIFIIIHLTNLEAQNTATAKQRMTKYHPQKSLSNSDRFVVDGLPPQNTSYKLTVKASTLAYSKH